jgi:hypothetical protein
MFLIKILAIILQSPPGIRHSIWPLSWPRPCCSFPPLAPDHQTVQGHIRTISSNWHSSSTKNHAQCCSKFMLKFDISLNVVLLLNFWHKK